MKQMDEIIYYPSTRAILIQELKTALEMYEKHEMTNEQLRYLVEHSVKESREQPKNGALK